jgi:hypothetical protein
VVWGSAASDTKYEIVEFFLVLLHLLFVVSQELAGAHQVVGLHRKKLYLLGGQYKSWRGVAAISVQERSLELRALMFFIFIFKGFAFAHGKSGIEIGSAFLVVSLERELMGLAFRNRRIRIVLHFIINYYENKASIS